MARPSALGVYLSVDSRSGSRSSAAIGGPHMIMTRLNHSSISAAVAFGPNILARGWASSWSIILRIGVMSRGTAAAHRYNGGARPQNE
eukprot:3063692-Pyramimonas_sp.AAC.1